jgi:hypothetical protein
MGSKIAKKIFFIAVDYIRYAPLTFVFGYIVFISVALLVGTNYEIAFGRILSFLSGSKEYSFTLDKDDISGIFFKIWFVLGTVFQLINRLTKLKVRNKKVFLIGFLVLLVLSILAGLRIQMFGVIFVFFIISIFNLVLYFLLSGLVEFLERLLDKL